MNQQDLDYLQHYGVLGMKWGVRKRRPRRVTSRHSARKAMRKADKYNRQYGVSTEMENTIKSWQRERNSTPEYRNYKKVYDKVWKDKDPLSVTSDQEKYVSKYEQALAKKEKIFSKRNIKINSLQWP